MSAWTGRATAALMCMVATALCGCPPANTPDGGTMDAGPDGARGLLTWSGRVCMDDGGCGPKRNHVSNTGLNGVGVSALRCTIRQVGEQTMVQLGFGFAAQETTDPTNLPGSLEMSGTMATTTGPVAPGAALMDCLVTMHEGSVSATGSCSDQCVATLVNYYPESGTVTGSVRCAALGSVDSGVPHLTLANADGVPGTNANFSFTGCDVAP